MEMILERLMFTCIGKGHGAPCLPANREDWEKLRREPWLKEMCERIERGDEQLKHRLPVWTPHCAEFKNNHRAIADAVRPLNRLMLDFDEKGHTDEICARLLEQSPLVPLLIEESVRRGTHVLVELPDGMTVDQAQQLMQEATGFEPDAAVKDVSRCIYMVPEDHTKYVSDKLFEVSEDCERKSEPTSDEGCELKSLPTSEAAQEPHTELMFKGIPYTSIIAEWWHRNGGEPAEGERNVKLHKLAVSLRAICDNKKEVLMQVMPRFGLSDVELRSVVDSACKETPKGISKMMQGIVSALEMGISSDEIEDVEAVRAETGVKVNVKALPMGLKESLAGVPVSMHMPVLCGVLPIAAAYADQVMVEYCDGNLQHLGLMSIIRGEQASNKSVVKNAIDVWKRQFDEEDALARKREEEWKERKKGRKANEKAPDDPKVLIRMVPVTVSCSTLLKRFKNAQGHTLYSFGEELDTLRKTNGAGSWSSKYDIYRLSFDKGEWGQDYNSDAAESGVVKVAYNWTMLGTNGALRKCFKSDNIENGLSSRILVAEMPDSSFSKMPKFGRRSAGDEAMIQEAVTRLRAFSGLIDTPRLRKAIEQWVEQKRVEAAKDIDHVKDTYRKRAAVIGFRCGVIFHLLETHPQPLPVRDGSGQTQVKELSTPLPHREGKGESRNCIKFALMMAEYCLSQQIKAFGEALQNQYVDAREECQRYGANHSVFDQLAPTFTLDDLRALKRGYCSESAMRMIISRWMRDGWISKTDRYHWSKVKVNSEK
ncbi:DUF3987 domain-containing protein [Prevotella communis]|uniref:DUF3987 domain-containing protein n=1 Tax=Prevotella communis TaxID=2913614 RepID=UPI001EDB0E1C|nr:DUF3987 domain-containing protein [Prevotella communis]UKK63277.1 DUF3987 domain-containing protein [Prevotella communis]UKK66102.1 DUF3987 domain-containing protein [Prevotella communis]